MAPPKKPKTLSWIPVRRGPIYCAPACGGRCTWAAYQQALKASRDIARRLGPGWEPNVWENLGWHFNLKCGPMAVYPAIRKGKFIITMANGPYLDRVFTTPAAAVRAQCRALDRKIQQMVAASTAARKGLRRAV